MNTAVKHPTVIQRLSHRSGLVAFALLLLSLLALLSSQTAHASPAVVYCSQGFVWRVAAPQDLVCVTPAVRSQAAYDNSQATVRRAPNGGPYGPDTCVQGYVWREAFANDHVCVTPQTRSLTRSDNLREQLFALINQDRAGQNLPAYTENVTLAQGAYLHSSKMAQVGQLAHVLPGEAAPGDRISGEGIQTTAWGENAGYASSQPDAWGGVQVVERSMMAEQAPNDGHRQNLLSSNFSQVGIGVVVDAKGVVWVTEDFVK